MNLLTFDIEDWYCNCFGLGEIRVPLAWRRRPNPEGIGAAGSQGDLFCPGWIVDHHPEIVRKIRDAGHQIGCHSFSTGCSLKWTRRCSVRTPNVGRRSDWLRGGVLSGVGVDSGAEKLWVLKVLGGGFKASTRGCPKRSDRKWDRCP